jgi:hypothetical protein
MTRNGRAAVRLRLLAVAVGLMVLAGCDDTTTGGSSTTTSVTTSATNTAPVTVGFGALGPAGGYANGIWTSVTVCVPGSTTNCDTIPNVLVDTGSVGLRLLSSAVSVPLPSVDGPSGGVLQECIQFASFAYVWGPVASASIGITGSGEVATQVPGQAANSGVPIQIIAASPSAPVPSNCLATAPSPGLTTDMNTLQTLGGNGILGIGTIPQDCGSYCVTEAANQYYVCPNNECTESVVPLQHQLWNPVSAFSSSDTNGELITLPSVAGTGAGSVTGSLTFGIGTQSNNAIGAAQVYETDEYGNFPEVVLNGVTYASPNNGSFIDSGSTDIFFSDAHSLASTGIVECSGGYEGYYCPTSTILFTATVYGSNNVSGPVQFNIANAVSLFDTGNAAFNDVGGDSGSGPSTDYVDLGLPFFLGRSIYVGIAGSNATYPNGFWAFQGEDAGTSAAAKKVGVRLPGGTQ